MQRTGLSPLGIKGSCDSALPLMLAGSEARRDTAGTTINAESKYWYAKGVGLVRQEISENDGAAVVSELSSYYSPSP